MSPAIDKIKLTVKKAEVKVGAKIGSKFRMPRSSMNAGKHDFTTLMDFVKQPEKQEWKFISAKQKEEEDKVIEHAVIDKKDLVKIAFKKNDKEFLLQMFTSPFVLSRIEDEAFFFLESRLSRTKDIS